MAAFGSVTAVFSLIGACIRSTLPETNAAVADKLFYLV
jgi:hypothetical protein